MVGRRQPGVPEWLSANLNYCSRCGAPLSFGPLPNEDRERLACPECGYIAYVNPRLVVSTIPIVSTGEIVLLRRGIEPGYGSWAQPGGFLEIDETAQQGAVRETQEETGYLVEPTNVVGIYTRPQAAIVVICWEARIVGGEARSSAESLEVRGFAPADIPWSHLAFQTTAWALHDWLSLRHADVADPAGAPGGRTWPRGSA